MERYRQIGPRFPAVSTCGMLIMVFIVISVVALDLSGSSGIAVASITREDGTPFEIAFILWKG